MKSKLFIVSLIIITVSCSPTEEHQANNMLNRAKKSYREKAFDATKIILDSIHQLYPQQIAARRTADSISWQIQLTETSRNIQYIDSILPLKIQLFDKEKRDFIYQKDTIYQNIGTYTLKQMNTALNAERCYLKPYINEHGDFFILSQYCGSAPLQHHQIQIEVNGISLITTQNGSLHSFNNESIIYETLLLKNSKQDNIADFISTHHNEKIKITLIGKINYRYLLTETDKKAFLKTQNLSRLTTDIYRLNQEKEKAELKINQLQSRFCSNSRK